MNSSTNLIRNQFVGIENLREKVKNVEQLDLSDIGRVDIADDGFRPFVNLWKLNLNRASLKRLDGNWFDENNKITSLTLNNNQVSRIYSISTTRFLMLKLLFTDSNCLIS